MIIIRENNITTFGNLLPLKFRFETDLDQWSIANIQIPVRFDYYSAFRTQEAESSLVHLNDYVGGKVDTDGRLCPEMPLPSTLACNLVVRRGEEKNLRSSSATCQLHVGQQSCIAPLHFDWDHRTVAHLCLSGSKRFLLIPPRSGWLLSPIVNSSALCLPGFSCADREAFLDKADGKEVRLIAGEGVLFLSSVWHAAIYEDISISVSIRFELDVGLRPFAVLPRNWLLQRLVWRLQAEGSKVSSLPVLQRLLEVFFAPCDGWYDRYKAINQTYRDELNRLGENFGVHRYVDDNFSAELALAHKELEFQHDTRTVQVSSPAAINELEDVEAYIFAGLPEFVGRSRIALAAHALRVRQGLEPKRGLIRIQYEDEDD